MSIQFSVVFSGHKRNFLCKLFAESANEVLEKTVESFQQCNQKDLHISFSHSNVKAKTINATTDEGFCEIVSDTYVNFREFVPTSGYCTFADVIYYFGNDLESSPIVELTSGIKIDVEKRTLYWNGDAVGKFHPDNMESFIKVFEEVAKPSKQVKTLASTKTLTTATALESDTWYFVLPLETGITTGVYMVDGQNPKSVKEPNVDAISKEKLIASIKARWPLMQGFSGTVECGKDKHHITGSLLLRFPYSDKLQSIYRIVDVTRSDDRKVILEDMVVKQTNLGYSLDDIIPEDNLTFEDLLMECEIVLSFACPARVAEDSKIVFEPNTVIDFLRGNLRFVSADGALLFTRSDDNMVSLKDRFIEGTFIILEYSYAGKNAKHRIFFQCFLNKDTDISLLKTINAPSYEYVGLYYEGYRLVDVKHRD